MTQQQNKYDRIQFGLANWTGFYRENPQRFAIDYFGMRWMSWFQQILLVLICKFTYVMIIASRGMGKTMIVAAAICVRCTLYPGLSVVIASGNRGQSINVLNKIVDEYMAASPNLCNEIAEYKVTPSDAYIRWKNGSIVRVVTARDSARSARANWVITDEFVQVKKSIIDKVLRKFKAGERTPPFYQKKKYKAVPKERNTETYISSAYYKWHYSWAKFKSYFRSMVKGESYVVCGFPYQLPVSAGYYSREQIREEMQEDDFDSVAWSMEMDSLFYGESERAFFSFSEINSARKLSRPIYPIPYYQLLGDSKLKYPIKESGEVRLISMDVATAGGAKNDATAISVMQLLYAAGGTQYIRNMVYMETIDGGHGQDQAIRIRQLYDDFNADYVIVDTNGVGMTVFDQLVQDLYDDTRGTTYEAWSCVNDESMAARSRDPDGRRIIYSIKATAKMNSEMAVTMRDCLRRGKLRLLCNEVDGNEILEKSKFFQKLSPEDQELFQEPYYQTSAFVNEVINLEYETVGTGIRVFEVAGMRKDRYSCVAYANHIASELERDMRRHQRDDYKYAPDCVSAVEF